MQIKKEDMEQMIIDCARNEFMIHGYENASMRTIAKKANTSLGNIYHYFPNKKAILDRILQPIVKELIQFLDEHVALEYHISDISEIYEMIEEVDFDSNGLRALMSKEFVIFMETREEEYAKIRQSFIDVFEKHIAWHLHMDTVNHFVKIVTKMLIDCVVHINRCDECIKTKKQDMIKMLKVLCRSVADEEDIHISSQSEKQ